MVTGRRSGRKGSAGLKFSPSPQSGPAGGGSRPVADQASAQQILLLVLIHLCRKVLFVETEVKIGLYLFALLVGSTVGDFLPLPRTYLSDKNNVLNQYFVKLGWGWTFSVVGAFVALTANVYCCGQRPRLKQHVLRLICATMAWFLLTSLFQYIERATGVCRTKSARFSSRQACEEAGFKWVGFDISGHAFLLIFNNLFIVEEAKAIEGWEGIKDMIRNEDFARERSANKEDYDDTPLQHIVDADYQKMKTNYFKHTPYIRALFVMMTFLSLLWDVMLAATIIYFHTMLQKVAGGLVAILAWYFLYRYLYPMGLASLPGRGGTFRYQTELKRSTQQLRVPSFVFRRRSPAARPPAPVREDVPKFMGMPLYALRNKENDKKTPSTAGLDRKAASTAGLEKKAASTLSVASQK